MAYEKNTWQTGDVVTAAKLNNMENGIADANTMIINVSEQGVMDKTWLEIHTALSLGKRVIAVVTNEEFESVEQYTTVSAGKNEDVYGVNAAMIDITGAVININFFTDSQNGYPYHSGWEP